MLVVYVVAGVSLWPVPLFNVLHAESSAVIAGVAFFAAGVSSLYLFARGYPFRQVLVLQEAALGVPWLLLTVAQLWAPNCGYWTGMLLYVLFPVITVVFAAALAYALTGMAKSRHTSTFCAVGLLIAVVTPLYDVGLHPQFYTYNHVFGGVLGPIYDEELALRRGLFAFRGLTLLWCGWLYLVGRWARSRSQQVAFGVRHWMAVVGLTLLIGCCYLYAAPLGINTPAWYTQHQLGGHLRTAHFDIYYDPQSMDEDVVARVADEHEYHYARLADRLDVEISERIRSYVYPDPAVKAALTGARYTNVAPVWLPAPQVHLLEDELDAVFPHELAHVFSRAFGLPVINASLAVGLVEGLAVAMEPPSGRPSTHDQVAADLLWNDGASSDQLTENMVARLKPLGFWTGRGAVSYTTMGSFVSFLIERYGTERFKRAYPYGRLSDIYGKRVETLVSEWEAYIMDLPVVAREADYLMRRRFSQLSLFEKRCPHYVPPYRRHAREGWRAYDEGREVEALAAFQRALRDFDAYTPALDGWARIMLSRQQPDTVVARLHTDTVRTSPALDVRLGDAFALQGQSDSARHYYERAIKHLPLYRRGDRARVALRATVADRREVVGALTKLARPLERARHLSRLPMLPAAGTWLAALAYHEGGEHGRAYRLLAASQDDSVAQMTPLGRRAIQRQHMIWMAETAYANRDFDLAERHARAARQAHLAVGDITGAAYLADMVRQVRWIGRAERRGASSHSGMEKDSARDGGQAQRRRARACKGQVAYGLRVL